MTTKGFTTPRAPAQDATELPRYFFDVYVKDKWASGDPWTLVPYLEPIELQEKSIHGDSTCTLRYEFGDLKREDQTAFLHEMPLQITDKFVCIKVSQDPPPPPPLLNGFILWVGYIPAEDISITGIPLGVGPFPEPLPAGRQTFTARGLEYLLDKRRMVTVPTIYPGYSGDPDPPVQFVNVVPTFNERRKTGQGLSGNRSLFKLEWTGPPPITPETYAFSGDGSLWTAFEILEFCLLWSDDWLQTDEPHFKVNADQQLAAFLGQTVTLGLVADDRSALSLVRLLVDQRRGLDAALRFQLDDNGFPAGDIELYLYTTTDSPVSQSSITMPANPNQVDVVIGAKLGEQSTVRLDSVQKYDEIVVQGEPMVSTFSAAGADVFDPDSNVTIQDYEDDMALLVPAWDDATMTEYQAATTASRSLPKYDRVLRRFRIVPHFVGAGENEDFFNWKANPSPSNPDPEGTTHFHPYVNADGTHTMHNVPELDIVGANSPFGNMNLKMLKDLALVHIADGVFDNADVHFEKPMAVVREMKLFGGAESGAEVGANGEQVWFPAHAPPKPPDDYSQTSTRNVPFRPDVSARVSVSDRELEVDVHFIQGSQALGYGDLALEDVGGEPDPTFDWRAMVITVSVQTDYRPSISVAGVGSTGGQKKLVLHVKDAQYWVCNRHATISGVSEEGNLIHYDGPWASKIPSMPAAFPEEGILRNDMHILQNVAALASVWYGRERANLTLTRLGILNVYPLGTFIRTILQDINRSNVGTVVTSRTFRFQRQETIIDSGLFAVDPRL